MTKPTLTAARLRELLRYEPDGTLHWRVITDPVRQKVGPLGAPAGHGGRLQMRLDGHGQYMHRLVWLYHHGDWPSAQVDHINGDKRDNRIENLRLANTAENTQNRLPRKLGAYFDKNKKARPWRAKIMVDGQCIELGHYDTQAEAQAAYLAAKRELHPFYVSGIGRAA